jgi:hypothetical protein
MSAAEIKAELDSRWRDDPIVRVCNEIVDYIASRPADQLQMISLGAISKAADKEKIDNELLRAIAILVSSHVAALDARGMLVDENENEHELDSNTLAEAIATGRLVHPQTGAILTEFKSKVFPFFVPAERFFAAEK